MHPIEAAALIMQLEAEKRFKQKQQDTNNMKSNTASEDIEFYTKEIEKLKSQLTEKDKRIESLRNDNYNVYCYLNSIYMIMNDIPVVLGQPEPKLSYIPADLVASVKRLKEGKTQLTEKDKEITRLTELVEEMNKTLEERLQLLIRVERVAHTDYFLKNGDMMIEALEKIKKERVIYKEDIDRIGRVVLNLSDDCHSFNVDTIIKRVKELRDADKQYREFFTQADRKARMQSEEPCVINQSELDIIAECDKLKHMLLEKNRAYGDSALNPVRIFSKADATEQIRVRIDDKISRIVRGERAGEDVLKDLPGYFVLLNIAEKRAANEEKN